MGWDPKKIEMECPKEEEKRSKRVLDVESSFFIFDIISLLLLDDDDFDDFDDTTDKHIDDTD